MKKVTPVHAHSSALRRHWWHHEVRPDHHWSHVAGGCIRSTPELSRRLPSNRCGSRRCDEGRSGRCRPFDSCAPRMVGGAQQSTLRPLDRAAANLAAAGTMESCAMILRAVHPWGLARPSKRPSLGNFQLPFHNAACSCDQLLHGTSGSGRAAAGTIAESCAARGIPGPGGLFTMLSR